MTTDGRYEFSCPSFLSSRGISCIKRGVSYRKGENVWNWGNRVIPLHQEITIQLFTDMKKETKENIKSNAATGASSAVGAGIGVVAGTTLANEVNAAETSEMPPYTEEEEVEVIASEPTRPTEQQTTPASGATGEPEVAVLGYERVTNDDGSQMDVAVVSVGGQQAVVADVDLDGTADMIVSDLNGDGAISDDEFVDVSGQGIMMASFQEAARTDDSTMLAQNPDYVNDADVTDYMA